MDLIVHIELVLGETLGAVLNRTPFSLWPRPMESIDSDTGDVDVEFPGRGVAFICTPRYVVKTVFLSSDEAMHYRGIWFDFDRTQLIAQLGAPKRSGEPANHEILGRYGRWDQFWMDGHVVHAQYRFDAPGISLITIMLPEFVPGGATH